MANIITTAKLALPAELIVLHTHFHDQESLRSTLTRKVGCISHDVWLTFHATRRIPTGIGTHCVRFASLPRDCCAGHRAQDQPLHVSAPRSKAIAVQRSRTASPRSQCTVGAGAFHAVMLHELDLVHPTGDAIVLSIKASDPFARGRATSKDRSSKPFGLVCGFACERAVLGQQIHQVRWSGFTQKRSVEFNVSHL